VGDGAGATDTREKRGGGNGGFAFDYGGVKAAVVRDHELKIGNLAVNDRDIKASVAFDFSDMVESDGTLLHRCKSSEFR